MAVQFRGIDAAGEEVKDNWIKSVSDQREGIWGLQGSSKVSPKTEED